MRVLISDNLSELGLKILQESDAIEVDVNVGLSPEELKQIIGHTTVWPFGGPLRSLPT